MGGGDEQGWALEGFCREELGWQPVPQSQAHPRPGSILACVTLSKSLTFPGPQFPQTFHGLTWNSRILKMDSPPGDQVWFNALTSLMGYLRPREERDFPRVT